MRATALVLFVLLLAASLIADGRFTTMAQEATPEAGAAADCPTTTPEENEALVRRWYEEVWNGRNQDAIDDVLAEDYVRYRAGIPYTNEPGTADDIEWVEMILTEFPDITFSVEDVIAADDKVAIRTMTSGTQLVPMVDMGNAPASERQMTRENIAIWRVECGQLAEQWIVQDNLGMVRHLGVNSDEEMRDVDVPTIATPIP